MSRRKAVVLACSLAGGLLVVGAPARGQVDGTAQTTRAKPDVVFLPTPQEVVEGMLELAEVKPGDLVYDLGCGDGRIVVTAAKKYGARAVGIDIDPQRVKESRENARRNGVDERVTIKQGDIFRADFHDATVVTLYLLPNLNVRLMPQLEKLKPGTRIVSHDFTMKGVRPVKSTRVNGHGIYLWTIPLDREPEDKGRGRN